MLTVNVNRARYDRRNIAITLLFCQLCKAPLNTAKTGIRSNSPKYWLPVQFVTAIPANFHLKFTTMKRRIKTVIYILPAYWASALINADNSGMDDLDIEIMNNWLKTTKPGACVGCSEESYFTHGHDANRNQGADVLEYSFHKVRPQRTIDKIITEVSSKYGAPLGRNNVGTKPTTITSGRNCKIVKKNQIKIFDCAVPLSNDGAYDRGGAYWGIGKQLRVEYTKDLSYIRFYRKD